MSDTGVAATPAHRSVSGSYCFRIGASSPGNFTVIRITSWVWPSSICVGALDRPHGGYVSNPRRLRDLGAVDEPDRHVAAGVAPQNVAVAVAVEVPGAGDRPGGRYVSDPHHLGDLRAVHQPDGHVAGRVAPQNVALAIAVEVPGAGDRPGGRYISDPHRLGDLRAVHQPHRHVAVRVMPEDVALAV